MNQQFARQAVQALTTAAAQQQEAAGQHVGTPDIRLTVAAETISGDRLTLIMTAAEQQHEAANAEVAGAGLGWQLARHEQFHGVYSIAHMPHLWLACLTIPARYTDKEAAGDLHYCVGVFNRPVVAAQWYDVATEIYEGFGYSPPRNFPPGFNP